MPTLEFDFRVAVKLNPEPSRVENRVKKEITTIANGRWSGSFGNGRVMVRITRAVQRRVRELPRLTTSASIGRWI